MRAQVAPPPDPHAEGVPEMQITVLGQGTQESEETMTKNDKDKETKVMHITEVKFRQDLYPRIKLDPALVQRYADEIERMPPIEVNQDGILIDGYHRLTAYKKLETEEVPVTIIHTGDDGEIFRLAIEKNAKHGSQLNVEDKKQDAIRLFTGGAAREQIANMLSVSNRTLDGYLGDIIRQQKDDENRRLFEMWMACHTNTEITAALHVPNVEVDDRLAKMTRLDAFPSQAKIFAGFQDTEFDAPLYNVWAFAKKTNEVSHFGNSEQRILENLLYLYTNPFDIVVDPFAGGGSTIDVCRKRLRRYYVSDRIPIVERESEIRKHDITAGLPPLGDMWESVSLTYLDPPYWRQAGGEYSDDPEDLGNMPLDQFTSTMHALINGVAAKQKKGYIAMLMQPTQWSAPNHEFTDHIIDIATGIDTLKLRLINRVSVPYSTQQCNAQMVEYAKAHKMLLVLSRELVIWRIRGTPTP